METPSNESVSLSASSSSASSSLSSKAMSKTGQDTVADSRPILSEVPIARVQSKRGNLLSTFAAALEAAKEPWDVAPARAVSLLADVFGFAASLGDPELCEAAM